MTALAPVSKQPLPLALALGVLGGGALVVLAMVLGPGPIVLTGYVALVLASFAAVRLAGWPEFSRRFVAAFLAFMVATVVFYLYVGAFAAGTLLEIPVWGHAWRLGLMAAIGGALSAAVSYLADLGRARRG